MVVKVRFQMDSGSLPRRTRELQAKSKAAVGLIANRQATIGEARMKTNAPWSDRTTAARSGLHTQVIPGPGQFTIVFSHSVNYGIWLEIANSGRYQIIMPTIRHIARQLADDLHQLWGQL